MRLKEYYKEKSMPILKKKLKIKNELDLPRLEKVIVSIGLSEARFDKKQTEDKIKILEKITGQKPKASKAKKAISNFKVKQGQVIAYSVTLRGQRMYDFVDKLINVVLPRIRDFRGLPFYSFDEYGNLSLGIKEHVAFPEVKMEEVEKIFSLGVTIVTTAKNKKEAQALFESLGAVVSFDKRKKETEKLESLQEMREEREKSAKDYAQNLSEVTLSNKNSSGKEED